METFTFPGTLWESCNSQTIERTDAGKLSAGAQSLYGFSKGTLCELCSPENSQLHSEKLEKLGRSHHNGYILATRRDTNVFPGTDSELFSLVKHIPSRSRSLRFTVAFFPPGVTC